jgi:eukaryotic-like serine/threonine-protein kinase
MLVREGGLSIERTADIMLAVCAGVFAAHQAGVIHRDLKPGNIFLARTPVGEVVPKVLDFGISKLVDEEVRSNLTGTGTVVGTTQYLSPEQVSGHPIDPRSDQYTVGVILYECVTGRNPHDGETLFAVMRSIAEARFRPPRQVRPDIPPTFEALILRAMRTDPAERYESVHSLGCALLPFATSKRRVLWADYFQGTGTGVPTGPVPVTPGSGPGPYQYLAIAHDTPPGAGQAAPTAPPPGMPPEPATPRMPPRPWPQQRPPRPLADWEPVDLAPRGMSWGKIIFIVGALTAVAVGAYRYFGPGATPPPVDPAASTSPTIPLPTTPTPTPPEQPAGAAPAKAESPEATAPVQPAPPAEAPAVPPPVPAPEAQVATPPAPPAPPAAGEAAPATAPPARDRTRTKRRPPRPRQPQSGGAPILD